MTASQLTSSTRHCLLASLCLLLFLLFCLKLPNILHPELGGPGGLGPPTSLFGTVFSDESKSFFKTIRIPLLPTNGSSSFGLGLNRTRAAERLSTLEACVDGSARRVGSWEDLPEFDEWTGDVLLQTDNRPVNFTSASAWTQRGHNEGGFVYNSLMAKQFGMLYVFIHGAEECVSPFGERLIGYWCKVPALRVAMYMFPRARSIIYIDSDAYIRASASPDAFYKVHELDLGENSPMYVQRDNSYWKVLVEEAYSVRYALNSGVIVFSPKSKLVKDALNLWWQALTRPRFQSNLDAYKSQIHMSLFFGESCTFNEQSVVLEDHAVLERFRKAFETLVSQRTKDVPLAHFFAPAAARVQDPQPRIDWIKLNYKDRNKRFVLKARFGHFANSTEISNIEKDLRQRPGKIQLDTGQHCRVQIYKDEICHRSIE